MDIKKITEFINIGNNKFILIIVLVGVCFMLFSGGGDKEEQKDRREVINMSENDEERLSTILSKIGGVGEVSVMITYYSTPETDIAYETKKSDARRDGEDTKNIEMTSDKQAVMSQGEPFVIKSIYPDVKGVLVVAEGASILSVKEKITEAVTTIMGIAQHRVCVVEKE